MSREEIRQAFLRGRNRWAGCDWPTRFGPSGLDLCALTAAQALLMARAMAGAEAAERRAAAQWLAEVEADARGGGGGEPGRPAGGRGEPVGGGRAGSLRGGPGARYRPAVVWRPLHEAIAGAARGRRVTNRRGHRAITSRGGWLTAAPASTISVTQVPSCTEMVIEPGELALHRPGVRRHQPFLDPLAVRRCQVGSRAGSLLVGTIEGPPHRRPLAVGRHPDAEGLQFPDRLVLRPLQHECQWRK